MAKLLSESQPIRAGVVRPVSSFSRVVSLVKQLAGGGPGQIGVSEIVGQRAVVKRIQVMAVWTAYTGLPLLLFDLYTGSSRNVAEVSLAGWDLLLPVFVGQTTQQWVLTPEFTAYDWSLNRLYVGDSRRFAISALVVGVGTVYAYVSIEVAEG